MPLPHESREARWRRRQIALADQALLDIASSAATDVTFIRHDGHPAGALAYVDAVEDRARAHGFVTARPSLREDRAFDSLDALVRAIAGDLTAPDAPARARAPTKTGILALLDAFVAREKRSALTVFESNLEALGVAGDLVSLARAYIAAAKTPRREAREIEAWLTGVELARVEPESVAIAALSGRTAKRALGELTRLVRALGFAGTHVTFLDGDVLLRLPRGRREDAFTVVREIIDNGDGGRGLCAARLALVGTTALFVGTTSLASLLPLASRIDARGLDPMRPSPHRPLIDLAVPADWDEPEPLASIGAPPARKGAEVRTLVRCAQGLPPAEAILTMSVGHERIDKTIDRLFEHSAMQGSVFALLSGAYGAGKTHLLLHLAARAAADKRPVFRLSLERLDADLGNPQRHLRRMLDQAELPLPGNPSVLDLLALWTRSPPKLAALVRELEKIRDEGTDASPAAARALRAAAASASKAHALETVLGAADLTGKPAGASYRHDAYGRLLLWLTLLDRLCHCGGPVLLIDEAENLYTGGASRSERRTALRTLAFYCGGALPRACVVMAVTPEVLARLQAEAAELLEEVGEQRTLLAWEDATMLRRRLARIRPEPVPALTDAHREVLSSRVRETHAAVRGRLRDAGWGRFVESLSAQEATPRQVVRWTIEHLEALALDAKG